MAIRVRVNILQFCSVSNSLSHTNHSNKVRGIFFKEVFACLYSLSQYIFCMYMWLPVFTELYNISIAHSISLEWHVWSSSSGNNCHAVHRSLSSGASVYDCNMGFYLVPFYLVPYAISSHNCHQNVSPPSGASLWNGMFGRVEGQYTTVSVRVKQIFWKISRILMPKTTTSKHKKQHLTLQKK